MMRIITPFFVLFQTAVLAQTLPLCGTADQQVCMKNSVAYQINCTQIQWHPGSIILLTIPGIVNNGPNSVHFQSGAELPPYWFNENNGFITDNLGGVWSPATSVLTDERGNRAISFKLQSGVLSGIVRIDLNQISVCQFVSDGPGPVYLNVQFWASSAQKTGFNLISKSMDILNFSECQDWLGYAPLVEDGDLLTIVNPHPEAVLLSIDKQESEFLEPYQQISITGEGRLIQINSSAKLGLVLRSEQEDLNLVSINSKDQKAYLLPHITNNPNSWMNNWKFATSSNVNIQSRVFGEQATQVPYESGLWSHEITTVAGQENTWMQLNTSKPSNGYFEFKRIDGIQGGAALNGLRLDGKPFGNHTLVLSHVASDVYHFWTGFTLTNPNDQKANVVLTGYRDDGSIFDSLSLSLETGQKIVEVIGQNLFQNYDGLSWIKIESDVPLAGIELFGGQNPAQTYLAGFLLTEETGRILSFPLLDTTPGYWSGLSLLNPGEEMVTGVLSFYDHSGLLIADHNLTLNSGEKKLILSPELSTQAVWNGDTCMGFVLIGDDDRQKLGGYRGIVGME
ncbi:MAG: hypothetical protein CR997_02040 [Acidobacteria bacterium]|nr:MAG: hypothetical protein CR997_02040 [Acidobacteriota bacterium]